MALKVYPELEHAFLVGLPGPDSNQVVVAAVLPQARSAALGRG